jgi:hypothetical protein
LKPVGFLWEQLVERIAASISPLRRAYAIETGILQEPVLHAQLARAKDHEQRIKSNLLERAYPSSYDEVGQ